MDSVGVVPFLLYVGMADLLLMDFVCVLPFLLYVMMADLHSQAWLHISISHQQCVRTLIDLSPRYNARRFV